MSRSKRWIIGVVAAGMVGALGTLGAGFGDEPASQNRPQVFLNQSQQHSLPVPAPKTAQPASEYAELIKQALQGTAQASAQAVEQLRRGGPKAVQALLVQPELRQSPRWSNVIDAVAQQRDAQFSGLYWHTDLNQALEVARHEHKPVLSLRLLGKLTDELSCANSRFFRTALYPNANVRSMLADKYVLHWQSVRSVPIITIDFGDGRKIERTITGNSLHVVLDEHGRTVDVLPGLYGPGVFTQKLSQASAGAVALAPLNDQKFPEARQVFHQKRLEELHVNWASDWVKAGVSPAPDLASELDDATWSKLAVLYTTASAPQGDAVRAVASKAPQVERAGRLALSKSAVETPMLKMVRNVTKSLSEDTVRNEFHLHARIHIWFAGQPKMEADPDLLVKRVYSELFLSPVDDPWYGLSSPDVYSAIPKDGRVEAVAQNSGG